MAQTQIKTVRPRHEAIMNYILANPATPMGEVAREFNVSQSWLSIIVNSQAFQDMLKGKQEDVFNEVVIPLKDKMAGVAHRAVERIGDKLEYENDMKVLLDIADKMAHRLGYAPSRGPEPAASVAVQQNNFYTVDPELLAQARARRDATVEAERVEDEPRALPST